VREHIKKLEEERKRLEHEKEVKRLLGEFIKIEIPEALVVHQFENHYVLAIHPDPIIEGHLILINNKSKVSLNELYFKEFKTGRVKLEVSDNRDPLNTPFTELSMPLSHSDWKTWFSTVVETKGIGFLQLLPYGKRNIFPLISNILHIIPGCYLEKKIKNLPLDLLIKNKLAYIDTLSQKPIEEVAKHTEDTARDSKSTGRSAPDNLTGDQPIQLDEFPFYNCFHILSPHYSEDKLKNIYLKCLSYLQISSFDENAGIILVLSSRWMFMAPLNRPFKERNGVEYFVDGLAYAGILNYPSLQKEWPQTANIDEEKIEPVEILEKSSSFSI